MNSSILSIIVALLAIAGSATAQSLTAQDLEAKVGEKATLTVSISGATDMTALQFNLSLPNGITVDETNIAQGEAVTNHTMTIRTLANGDRMFVFYNMDKKLISNGSVLSLPVTMPKEAGVLNGKICTVRTASTDWVSHKCSDVAFTVTVKDDVSSIVNVNTTQTDNKTVYDMSGRRVKRPAAKGIYINNGRKVVVK